MRKSLTIGWLYPELMSTYGDRGNIIALQKRCDWRGIEAEILRLDLHFNPNQLKQCDLLFMGGAQDRQQQIVSEDLMKKSAALKEMIGNNVPGLYVCGAYQSLGKYYKDADGTIIPGLDILDSYTVNPGASNPRLIGNVAIEILNTKYLIHNTNLVGFENHGGRTYLGKLVKPLGKVIKGFGNNGDLPAMLDGRQVQAGDGTEGAIYKNSFGTYLHGPILPKNPEFADLLIKLALEKKYKKDTLLSPLNDSLEIKARNTIAKRLNIKL
ncbi:MAG: cobalamin biosynthesis protein CobQ [Candidatus Levybacteria bacterium]|nr:cobalamin biosynthesis protein CobQ [Candidatus Levybacteria bacterium]